MLFPEQKIQIFSSDSIHNKDSEKIIKDIEDNNIPLRFYQKYRDNLLNDTYMKYWNICYSKY